MSDLPWFTKKSGDTISQNLTTCTYFLETNVQIVIFDLPINGNAFDSLDLCWGSKNLLLAIFWCMLHDFRPRWWHNSFEFTSANRGWLNLFPSVWIVFVLLYSPFFIRWILISICTKTYVWWHPVAEKYLR